MPLKRDAAVCAASPVALIVTADDGGVGKTTAAVQLATAFSLAGQPLELFQMDTKGKLGAKSGEPVTSLVVGDRREHRGEDLIAVDVIAPWYRATTSMPGTGRSTLIEIGGAMAQLFHTALADVDLAEDVDAMGLRVVPFVLCKAGEDSAVQLLRELRRLDRNLPNSPAVIVLNEVLGDPANAAQYFDNDLRKAFTVALKKYATIRMPRVRPRSMAIYERLHALPSTIVAWHVNNYAEAIQRTGRPRDEAKVFVKDIAEWSGIMQDEIARVLPFLTGGRDG